MGFESLYDFNSFIAFLLKSGVKINVYFFLSVIKWNAKIKKVYIYLYVCEYLYIYNLTFKIFYFLLSSLFTYSFSQIHVNFGTYIKRF